MPSNNSTSRWKNRLREIYKEGPFFAAWLQIGTGSVGAVIIILLAIRALLSRNTEAFVLVLLAFCVVVLVIALIESIRQRTKAGFTPFHITTSAFLWRIKRDPDDWIELDPKNYNDNQLEIAFEGPYCAHKEGNGEPCRKILWFRSHISNDLLRVLQACPDCGAKTKVPCYSEGPEHVWKLRERVLLALKNHVFKYGKPITKNIAVDL